MNRVKILLSSAVLTAAFLAPIGDAGASPPAPLAATKASHQRVAVLDVEGVSCAGCSLRIRNHLRKLVGVSRISGAKGKNKKRLEVEFDKTKVTPTRIAAVIEKAGFEARVVAVRRR